MDSADRKKLGQENLEWGHEAEQIAAEYFLKEGYLVRERNWKCGRLEIDLILEKERTIIFVEVKARKADTQDPVQAVNPKKIMRIVNAADAYMRGLQFLYEYRFDIVTFTGNRDNYRMEHYADAFLPPVNGGRR